MTKKKILAIAVVLIAAAALMAATVIGYIDLTIYGSAPANPATGYDRLYVTSAGLLCKTSTGASCLVTSSATAGGVNAQTGSYTAVSGDSGKLVSFNCSSACTLTLPASPPSSTWWILTESTGTGTLTVSRNSLNIDGAAANLTLTQHQGTEISTDGSNYFTERGMGATGAVTSLTTAGASGAATLTGGVLNIPVYSSGGGSTNWPFTFSMPSSGWSWLNQNVNGSTNTVDTSNSNIVLTSNGAGDGLASYVRSKIASTFTITTAFAIQPGLQSSTTVYSAGGLILTDGTKFVVYNLLFYNGLAYLNGAKWTNATTFSAAVTGFTAAGGLGNGGYLFSPLVFLRITETATARTYYISPDYRTWVQVGTTSNTDFLTTSNYGLFVRAAGSQVVASAAYSFTETNP